MNPKKIIMSAALAISAIFVMFLLLDDEARAEAGSDKLTVPKVTEVMAGKGKMAPNFMWEEDGKTKTFAEMTKGKVVFVNFWATWCPPCRREIPDIIKLNKDLKAKGNDVIFVGIGLDRGGDANQKLTDYINSSKFNYPVYHEESGKLATAFGGAASIPTTYIISKKGEIVDKIVGMRSYGDFENAIKLAMTK